MKELKYFLKERIDVTFYSILLILLFPILPFNITSLFIIVFSVLSVFLYWDKAKEKYKLYGYRPLIQNTSFFLLMLLTLFYSDDLHRGFKSINVGLGIFLFPLIIFYFQPAYTQKQKTRMSYTFIIANVLFLAILLAHISKNVVLNCYIELSELNFFQKLYYLRNVPFENIFWCSENLSESPIFVHKVYNSLSLILASILLLDLLFKKRTRFLLKLLLGLTLLLFAISIFYLFSLINIILFSIIIPLYLLFLVKNKFGKWAIILLSVVMGLFVGKNLIRNYADISFEKIVLKTNKVIEEKRYDGIKERMLINKCNFEIIAKNPIIGIGIGDVQNMLNTCYTSKIDMNEFYEFAEQNKMNSHNYYYFLLQSGGVIMLLSFIILLFKNTVLSIRAKSITYFFFTILFLFNLFTENILSRMYGVVLFSLFNSLFFIESLRKLQQTKISEWK